MSAQNLEFKWGKKRGVGVRNKEVQFYESMKYDGVEYELYDCVYMWKENESEPFVGKIIKMWEDKYKKVKILWFFKPAEILNWLDGAQTNENELFLGSGEGLGLVNVNLVEAISGKCNVICISKDDRNPQPTEEELQGADYVFYRIFDVQKLALSENIPGKIAGIDLKYIFNRREGQQPSEKLVTNDNDPNQTENGNKVNTRKPSEDKSKAASQREDTVGNNHWQEKNGDELDSRPFKKPRFDSGVNLSKEKDKSDLKLHIRIDGTSTSKSTEGKKANVAHNSNYDLVHNAEKAETRDYANELKGKLNLARGSIGMDIDLSKKKKYDEELLRFNNVKVPKASNQTSNKQNKTSGYGLEVTRRPDADRRKWFKELPWDTRMENAHRQGALVLLENLDPSYTSADVEDIIGQGFKESCTAKIVYRAINCSPFSGQAFMVFKTKEVAEKVVKKLEQECLMLSNGRPLIASFGNPCFPGKEALVGHFGIDKLKTQISREKRKAVSTSHCSQPNSIEYEFAMEWCLLQEKSSWGWKNLHKQQAEEVKKVMEELKTKLT